MHFFHIFLLSSLGFAILVALLLLLYLCNANICSPPSADLSIDEEEGGILFTATNNNNTDGRLDEVLDRHSLRSQPSAPLLTDLPESHGGMGRQTSRLSVNSHCATEDIRAVQNSLVRNGLVCTANSGEDSSYNMVIGVNAQANTFGGYCISLKGGEEDKWVEFYSIQREDLPWRFGSDSEETELQAKNFLFALMLWSDAILEAKRIRIHTGNHAVVYDNNKYGRRATKLIEHYSQCEGIIVVNDYRFLVSSKKDPKSYAEHIQPAEDLSCGSLREFHDFVSQYYDIGLENFRGTQYIPPFRSRNEQAIGFETTNNYSRYIQQVRSQMSAWTEPCAKCGYVDDETASMLSINRIP